MRDAASNDEAGWRRGTQGFTKKRTEEEEKRRRREEEKKRRREERWL